MELLRVKNFLRVDTDEDDELISAHILTAEEYVKGACGEGCDLNKEKAQTVMLMLIADMYEQRTAYGKGGYSESIKAMLTQLRLETEIEAEEEKNA